ncbi:rab9 effector protein with kelch motifs-like [Anneissia japonica]|uniref:rab9 effector protein with kelch motifs-like n=1 Tax=Anneissia japonica TaxID=1529436 RepID=UPI0014256A44|nr:rab9 effector protein with kelch motifs-like [Anneissia japonica]XP_033098439.1 rab9 effector protein with kelch motifs-like [Anneissia japonica]
MELHPILEAYDIPNPGIWYVLSARGVPPSMRVGHTCVFVPGSGEKRSGSKLLIIGGANPSGSFGEAHSLDFDQYEWDTPDWSGLQARYEHTAWLTNNSIYVFGGAEMNKNLNTVQKLDLASGTWTTPVVRGTPPSPRTCHSHATDVNMMYVFGGGEAGAEPVADRQIHVFDASTLTWSQPKTSGKSPKARHGHVMVVISNKLFIHGGMSRGSFFEDVHELQLKTMTWKQVRCKGDIPSGRAAHSAIAYGNHFIISCGMNQNGAMDDLYNFNTDTSRWTKLNIEGPPPACRLDHSMCRIEWNYKQNKKQTEHSITNQENLLGIQELTLCDGNFNKEENFHPEDVSQDEDHGAASGDDSVRECASEAASSAGDTATETALSAADASKAAPCAADTASGAASSAPDTALSANKKNTSDQASLEGAVEGKAMSDDIPEEGSYTLLLMYGGMDTQGEIFDDILVCRINLPT